MDQVEAWKQSAPTPPQREAFASAALESKDRPTITADQLLTPRRSADFKPDLWTTTNVIQDHLLKGGDAGRSPNGRRTRTREVKSVDGVVRLDRALRTLERNLPSR